MDDLYRVCVKLYAANPPAVSDDVFVPIFHEWIRTRALDIVLIDVVDYTHVPASPGVMLVSHEVSFALDRADGRFGLLAQRRRPVVGGGGIEAALATTLRQAVDVAARLEREPRLRGKLTFDTKAVSVEANDRLHAPNTDDAYNAFAPRVAAVVSGANAGRPVRVSRVSADPRNRLAVHVEIGAGS